MTDTYHGIKMCIKKPKTLLMYLFIKDHIYNSINAILKSLFGKEHCTNTEYLNL